MRKNICDHKFLLIFNKKGLGKFFYSYRVQKSMEKTPKNAENFVCEKCAFVCCKQSEWDRHIARPKHIGSTFGNKKTPKNAEIICAACNSSYKHRSGLWKHKKVCNGVVQEKEIIDLLIKENSEFKNIVLEMVKSNGDLQKQMIEVCKNSNTITHINNNNNNSHNKTFNLQVFLNEQCKDAMNISEFVNTFDLQLEDLESVGELGYVEGMTKIILDKLNSMDIYKRPMHCSDAKRETLYIKDENIWAKEERNNPKLRQAIKTVTFRNMKQVKKWSDKYPESLNNESRLNDKYMMLVIQSTGGNGLITDSENKIIRRITKEILIHKL